MSLDGICDDQKYIDVYKNSIPHSPLFDEVCDALKYVLVYIWNQNLVDCLLMGYTVSAGYRHAG